MNDTQAAPPTVGARIIKILEIVGAAFIFAMMLHVLANVAGRFLLNSPLHGTLEIVQYWYMPVVAFLGFIVAKHLGEHIEAPLIFDGLSWGNRRILVMVNGVIAVVTSLLFSYFIFTGSSLNGLEVRATAGASTIPIWPVLFLPPVVYLVLSVQWAIDVFRAARGQIDERGEAETALATFTSDEQHEKGQASS